MCIGFVSKNEVSYVNDVQGASPPPINLAQVSKFIYYNTPIPSSSNASGIASASLLNDLITIYPNPASDNVVVNIGNASVSSVVLTDITGKNRMSSADGNITLNNTGALFNVSSLSKGIYLLEINVDNLIVTKKLVVN